MDMPRHVSHLMQLCDELSGKRVPAGGLCLVLRWLPEPGPVAGVQNLEVGEASRWNELRNSGFGQNSDSSADGHAGTACANTEWGTEVDGLLMAVLVAGDNGRCDAAVGQGHRLVLARNAGKREHVKRQQICNDAFHVSKVGEMPMQQVGKNKIAASKRRIAVNQPLTPMVI